ncbi:hypothetical protein EZV73_21080 [Acidaminobacter sp. JC074]|uniref:hypothetical protein n=1 Tax=Acidaminobacter sp. JC074 TaxID=2530199 RepID=UPI001F0EDC5A|nr:hypothetical protein [Acidaminobacter sp. JC074]MCH4890087.1 hypothetical protein [Acidaminobacter sp. JC074]
MKTMKKTLKDKKILFLGLLIFIIYFLLYYWSIGYLNFGANGSHVRFSSNWVNLVFKRSSTFLFEPVGSFQNFGIHVLVSPMNILLGLLLSLLVFFNVMAAFYIYKLPKQCRLDHKYTGLIGILPSFLTGFACCAPTFLIPLASIIGSSTAFLSSIMQWFLPLSVLLLVYGIYKSYRLIQSY